MQLEQLRTRIGRRVWSVTLLAVGLVSSGAQASELIVPNVFTAGDPAVAAEVNENFSDTATAVNDNDARIEALEAQVAALQAALASLQSNTNANTSGLEAVEDRATLLESRADALEARPQSIVISDAQPAATTALSQPGTGQFGPRVVLRSIAVPAGHYVVSANADLLGMQDAVAVCEILAVRDVDGAERTIASTNLFYGVFGSGVSSGFNVQAPLVGQLPESFTPATIEYACRVASGSDTDDRDATRAGLHAISAAASSEQ